MDMTVSLCSSGNEIFLYKNKEDEDLKRRNTWDMYEYIAMCPYVRMGRRDCVKQSSMDGDEYLIDIEIEEK